MKLFGTTRKQETPAARRRRQSTVRPVSEPQPPAFRRNRTMTDRSTVPEVSERARIHHLRKLRRKVGAALGIALLVLAVMAIGVSQFTQSVYVALSDDAIVHQPDTERYKHLFDEYFQRHPLQRFRFATNYDQLSQWIQVSASEVAKVTPRGLQSLGTAKYEIRLRQPLVSWTVDGTQYYVDTNGVTFTRNYFDNPTVAVVDESGARVEQGSAIASTRLLSFVGRAVALASDSGFKVQKVELPTRSMRQVYLHGEGVPIIRMTIDRGVEYQIEDMRRALGHFGSTQQTPPQYIDVRTSGKVFYQE